MAAYVIGDVHGCYDELQQLLEQLEYNPQQDQLFFTGDLVGRGPQPLAVLRKVMQLPNCRMVLGNHDLHLIAIHLTGFKAHPDPSFREVLDAPDSNTIIDWLRHQPLALYDDKYNFLLVHAGIAPDWSYRQTLGYAAELASILKAPRDQLQLMIQDIYGDEPDSWHASLAGLDRLRVITNYVTRMRQCSQQGQLWLKGSAAPSEAYKPWFDWQAAKEQRIIFGHWAALAGKTNRKDIIALDHGCVWGNQLAALSLDDDRIITISARQSYQQSSD